MTISHKNVMVGRYAVVKGTATLAREGARIGKASMIIEVVEVVRLGNTCAADRFSRARHGTTTFDLDPSYRVNGLS